MQGIAGSILTASFTYDANGNETAGETGKALTYTSFNKPATITEGSNTATFSHDTDHQRFKQVATNGSTTLTTDYVSGFGILAELVVGSGGSSQWNEYLFVGGEMVGERVNVTHGAITKFWFHKDHLGSMAALSDATPGDPNFGNRIEQDSYDSWGRQRHPNGTDDAVLTGSISSVSTRGYTGQEELADVSLIHYNGRVYDPLVARFTSPDPMVDQPDSSQGWNRYAYVGNNPLAFTDPNGYSFLGVLGHFFNPIQHFKDVLAITRAVYSIPYLGQALNVATAAVVTFYTGGCVPCGVGVYSALSSLQAGVTSGDIGEAFKVGAISGAEGISAYVGGPLFAGVVAGGISSAEGQSFQSGFLPAAFASFAGPVVGDNGFVADIITGAVIGGTASVLGGGKFENGAISGTFDYVASAVPNDIIQASINGSGGGGSVDYSGHQYAAGGPVSDDASLDPSALRAILQKAVADDYISQADADRYFANSLAMQQNDALRLQTSIRGYFNIPGDWTVKATDDPGLPFFNPSNKTDNVRIMFGNPNNPNPIMQGPYVRDQINGLYMTPGGTRIPGGNPATVGDTHIPLNDYVFSR